MKAPQIELHPAGSRAEIEAYLRETLTRGDLSTVAIGAGPEDPDRIIIAERQLTRHCGDCEFCCSAAGINELEKPPMVRCPHLAKRPGRGCSIYHKPDAGFPKACGTFKCAWLIGNFESRHRPDKIGAYVAFFLTEDQGFYAVVQVDSRRVDLKRLAEVVARLTRRVPEVRIIFDDKHGAVIAWGEKKRRFQIMPRPSGDYEVTPMMFIDD
jgi:hypothetical protein